MQRRAASALHLALFLLGVVLYFVFILPRWWVLTGDIPTTLATAGRIAAGVPIALAAVPVVLNLRESLKTAGSGTPELALRLRAWSGVLHVLAGVLIILTAIVEIWVGLDTAGPWLFAVYGAAAAIAVLGIVALYLSRVAEKPPAETKPPKAAKPPKAPKEKKPKRRKRGGETDETGTFEEVATAKSDEEVVAAEQSTDVDATDVETQIAETNAVEAEVVEAEVVETEVVETEVVETEVSAAAEVPASGGLRNKRPTGKSRHRLPR